MEEILKAIGISLLPIGELRAGIPFALVKGINPLVAYLVCCGANIMVYPLTFIFLSTFHKGLIKWSLYESVFSFFEKRVQKKLEGPIQKYGFWALMIFVMIPLPVTGAYSGTLAAWAFKIPKAKGFLAVSLGVLIAGVIVSVAVLFFKESLGFLIKE